MVFGSDPLEVDEPRRPALTARSAAWRTALNVTAAGTVAAVWADNLTAIVSFYVVALFPEEIRANVAAIAAATIPVLVTAAGATLLAWAGSASRDREFSAPGPTPIAKAVGKVLIVLLVLSLAGCAAQAWPPAIAFGQSSIQGGPCERYFGLGGELEWERCNGTAIHGGAISDSAGRAIGVVGDAAVRAGTALGGVPPAPPKAMAP